MRNTEKECEARPVTLRREAFTWPVPGQEPETSKCGPESRGAGCDSVEVGFASRVGDTVSFRLITHGGGGLGHFRPLTHGLPPRYRLRHRVRLNIADRPRAVVDSHPEIQLSLDEMLSNIARRKRDAARRRREREERIERTR